MITQQYCNSTAVVLKIHTVTVDYPITWVENTVTVELFLAMYYMCMLAEDLFLGVYE